MSQRKNREEELFDAARGLGNAGERVAFLDGACDGNAALRRRVDDLLAAQAEADDLFRPLLHAIQQSSPAAQADLAGTVIGRYKLLEKIGEGGMGIVYLAEQKEPVRRRVALKIIKLGMDTRQVVARFEAERQALALMDHPNIAKVLDGGAIGATDLPLATHHSPLALGRPYFVMELVDGVPITEFCERHELSLEQRLLLCIPVCQAVQHAHQKGVIHRDLKPSNVMVALHDGVPVPKVIDFGVAKATNQQLTEKTLFTRFNQWIGTPAYMSPEQAEMSGLDVDTRSDIYSLGVLLYELLTGTQPFPEQRLRSVAYAEMQRIVTQEPPERPSTRLRRTALTNSSTPFAIRHSSFTRDLDWIVMKCLEKDRNRRYETANGLVADLRRFLSHEPVVARPPSAVYRLGKYVRRHRAGSVAAALIALAVVIGGVVSSWALVGERGARRMADERLRVALGFVDQVITNVAPQIETLEGAATARQNLAQASYEVVDQLRSSAARDPVLRTTLVRALLYLSSSQNPGGANTVGDYAAGLRYAREAIALLGSGDLPLGENQRLNLLVAARFSEVMCLYGLGCWEEGVRRSDVVATLYERLEQLEPDRDQARLDRRQKWNARANAGYSLLLAGQPGEAIQRTQAVLDSDWAQGLAHDARGFELETLANAHANLAVAQGLLGRLQPLLAQARAADQLWTTLVERFPKNARYKAGRIEGWSVHGWASLANGQADDGLALLDQSRREIDGLVGQDPTNDQFLHTRAVRASTQALAYVAWSGEATAAFSVRRERVDRAEQYLAEAEGLARLANSKEAEARVVLARDAIAAAKRGIESDTSKAREP